MNDIVGQTIKNLRLGMDISQETLAKALGVSTQAVEHEWRGTLLPAWGEWIPDEEQLCLFGDLSGKNVLEIACGDGQSLLYISKRNVRELWGIDLSEKQVDRAKELLCQNGVKANLFVSPMEVNPGLPENYFDCIYSVYGIGWTMDLNKVISQVAKYLKTNGTFIFSWDNPILPCIDTINGQYVLNHSYVDEPIVRKKMRGEAVIRKNWKLSSYINALADNGFKLERLVEDSVDIADDVVFTDKYYSEYKAQFIHHSFVIKARKL